MTTGGPPNWGSLPVRLKFHTRQYGLHRSSKVVRKRRGTIGYNAVTFHDDVDGLRRAVLPIQVVVEIERGLLRKRGSDVGGDDSRQVVRRATAERHVRSRHDVAEHRALRNEHDDNENDEAEANPPVEATYQRTEPFVGADIEPLLRACLPDRLRQGLFTGSPHFCHIVNFRWTSHAWRPDAPQGRAGSIEPVSDWGSTSGSDSSAGSPSA